MIKSLDYNVTFAKTGRQLAASLSFEKGLTAITGPNETGKSMVIEALRWLLFGSEALRGTADDYASMTGSLEFEVKGQSYTSNRSLKGGKLYKGDELLCTGTRPMNSKVVEILGFDLQVFDISCAANQGDVEKLANMKPTERKQMVDRVIGADKITELAKWCGDEATLSGREVAILEKGLVEPTPPVVPQGYQPSETIQVTVEDLRVKQRQLSELYGQMKTKPQLGPEPVHPGIDIPMSTLLKAEELFQLYAYDFDPVAIQEAWDAYDLWQVRVQFVETHPRPTNTRQEVQKRRELLSYQSQIEQLIKSPVIKCPCGKPFRTTDQQIEDLQFLIDELGPVPVFDVQEQERRLRDWDNLNVVQIWEKVRDIEEVFPPNISRRDLERAQAPGSIHISDRKQLAVPYESLEGVRAAIRAQQVYDSHTTLHAQQRAALEEWEAKAVLWFQEITSLEPQVAQLQGLERGLAASLVYEAMLARYDQDLLTYQERSVELADKQEERESWSNGKVAMNILREKIKTHLVPSLSKAASSLLSQMTGGARNSIVVDEEFEVMVDGQPISTLSGSGKACANLALRIGLGQVLTNNVLSIFIGDEIDASMDEERANNIQTSLGTLQNRISQIILVTHKIPQADHLIALGGVTGGGHRP